MQETKLSSDDGMSNELGTYLSDFEVFGSHAVSTAGYCFLCIKKYLPVEHLNVVSDESGSFILVDFFKYED